MIKPTSETETLHRLYETVLASSFSPIELGSLDDFVTAALSGRYEVLVDVVDDELRGAIVIERFGEAALVVWLAVGAAGRGHGVGSALLAAARERWASRVEVLLAEIERPDVFAAHPEHGDPARRLEFYARHGATALDVPYFQASLGEGLPRVHGLLLTALSQRHPKPAPRQLTAAEQGALGSYIDAVLGDANDEDAQLVRASVHSPDGVRMLPITDYEAIALTGGIRPSPPGVMPSS